MGGDGNGCGQDHGGGDVVDCNDNHVVEIETVLINTRKFTIKLANKVL